MRTIREATLDTRKARERLAPRKKPYLRTLVPRELALGYRRREGEPGTWGVRRYIGNQAYVYEPLGTADDYRDDAMTFAQAQALAFERGKVAAPQLLTAAAAVLEYVEWLKLNRATGYAAERRALKVIIPQLGKLKVSDLTTAKINSWRDRLAQSPAMKRTRKGIPQQFKAPPATADQRRATANRTLTILKAALNYAFNETQKAKDDTAWRRVKPFDGVSAARPDWLTDIEDARRLINAAAPDFRPMIQAALLTGCRYSEICALRCRDFQHGKVYIESSKSRERRDVVLTNEGVAFFEAMTAGRPADGFIFVREDGNPWAPSLQTRPMKQACLNAGIKPIGIHQLRHTYASHAIKNGMPLLILAGNLGHKDTRMVERHYGHLTTRYEDDVIKSSAPVYGITAPGNVQRLR